MTIVSTEDDDSLGQNREHQRLSEKGHVLGDSSDGCSSDVFLGHTGSDTGESDSESGSNRYKSCSNISFHCHF